MFQMRENPNKIVGKKIRQLRLVRGLSQEEFAGECQLHRTYVGSVERGERNITLITLKKFANALKVSMATLLEYEN